MSSPHSKIIDSTLLELMIFLVFMFFLYVAASPSLGFDSTATAEGQDDSDVNNRELYVVSVDVSPCFFRRRSEPRRSRALPIPQIAVRVTNDRFYVEEIPAERYEGALRLQQEGSRFQVDTLDVTTVLDSIRETPGINRLIDDSTQRTDGLSEAEFIRYASTAYNFANRTSTFGWRCRFFADVTIDRSVADARAARDVITGYFFLSNNSDVARDIDRWEQRIQGALTNDQDAEDAITEEV